MPDLLCPPERRRWQAALLQRIVAAEQLLLSHLRPAVALSAMLQSWGPIQPFAGPSTHAPAQYKNRINGEMQLGLRPACGPETHDGLVVRSLALVTP